MEEANEKALLEAMLKQHNVPVGGIKQYTVQEYVLRRNHLSFELKEVKYSPLFLDIFSEVLSNATVSF